MTDRTHLKHVRLIGVPLDLWERGRVWFEGLLREFDILAADPADATPRDLVVFVEEARSKFGGFTRASDTAAVEALRRGEERIDIAMEVPPEAAPAARNLLEHVRKANEYCRRGDLLTLTLDEDLYRYLEWYMSQVADQIEGASPRSWDEVSQPPTR